MANQSSSDKGYDIELSGHHLHKFASFYFKWRKQEEVYRKMIKLQHKEDYSASYIVNLWKNMINNKDLQVRMVNGLDDICLSACQEVNKLSCIGSPEEDEFTLKEYGLRAGGIYFTGELLSIIEKYREETGQESPFLKWLKKTGFSEFEIRFRH